jgi:CRP-like cAMP-binding protein
MQNPVESEGNYKSPIPLGILFIRGAVKKIPRSLQSDQSGGVEAIQKICSGLVVKKNDHIQQIGQTCRTIYFIKKGVARIYYFKDGMDITDSFSFENEIVVRVESLFTGAPSRKGIQALEEVEIIAIDAVKLFQLYDTYPAVERLFRKIFELEYIATVKRIESIQFHSAEERYLQLLNESKQMIQRVPLKFIASYLGITQVSLSRIRAKV